MEFLLPSAINCDVERSILTSESQIYKTERFIKETARIRGVDFFISKLAEGVINAVQRLDSSPDISECYKLVTTDGEHAFFFKFGVNTPTKEALRPMDIVFFRYLDRDNNDRKNDLRLINFVKINKLFKISVTMEHAEENVGDFNKLYILANSDQVNFPLLNAEQRKLVETEDANVLVQGVAGSGKTNVCIDKIIYTACREYSGNVLYSTFSRGLLVDTQTKVGIFKNNLEKFIDDYEHKRIIFADKNHKKAIELKLGLFFSVDADEKLIAKIRQIAEFLDKQVDNLLIEDFYVKYLHGGDKPVGEDYFKKIYVKNIRNHQLVSKLNKVKYLSYEVIYKELYGIIYGCYDINSHKRCLSLEEYREKRKESFSNAETEVIYSLSQDYYKYLAASKLTDNNIISRLLLANIESVPNYSLAILDEVQDLTEVNLCFLKKITRKMFCVGDALQMINPSFFSFAYLKRLLFTKDEVSVSTLAHNYRNTKKIAEIIDKLGELNTQEFGTHNFVVKGESVDSDVATSTVYVAGQNFPSALAAKKLDSFTVVVNGIKEKEALRKILTTQEILTVSEIKGLERDTVILFNVLSDNADKWKALERTLINRKQADENSVYRYYFNLFYVGLSRARNHLYVAEEKEISNFKDFLQQNFETCDCEEAAEKLLKVIGKLEIDRNELLDRTQQFLKLEQYDNARFTANKIMDDEERTYWLNRVDITERYVKDGKYRDAGIAYWEKEMYEDAKAQFDLSGDKILIDLLDACLGADNKGLDVDIVKFFNEVEGNETARKLILQVVKNDLSRMKNTQNDINKKFNSIKEKING